MRNSLADMETFLAVMDLGTVTAAAARLNLAKSVVSKRIAALEDGLGVALFRRSAGRITPTEAALRLAERLRPALVELAAVTESVAQGAGGDSKLRGRLAIAAPMSLGTLHLGPVIARFALANPELDIRVDYDDRLRDLAREGFDIGIRVGQLRDAAVKQRRLCTDRLMICASPDYLARHGTPAVPADLDGHAAIGYGHVPDSRFWRFRSGGRTILPALVGRLSLNNGEAIRDMAVAGLGLAVLPRFIIARDLAEGRLTEVLPGSGARDLPISAVWPVVEPMPAKLRRLVDHLVAELDGCRPWAGATAQPG